MNKATWLYLLAALLIGAVVAIGTSYNSAHSTTGTDDPKADTSASAARDSLLPGMNEPMPACHVVADSRQRVVQLLRNTELGRCYDGYIDEYLQTFEGTRYGAGGSGIDEHETLINTREMDCVTLTENILAMSMAHREASEQGICYKPDHFFQRFVHYLNEIRYYDGQNCGWESRIYYFSDAMHKLVQAGYLTNVGSYNGEPFQKTINYISQHKYKYPGIDDWAAIQRHERKLSNTEMYYYPLDKLEQYEKLAQNGDIVTLTTTKEGLAVSHVGFITLSPEGELLFTHASSVYDKVKYEMNFRDYLDTRTTITGIMAYRPDY
jgi:hypothetical protein